MTRPTTAAGTALATLLTALDRGLGDDELELIVLAESQARSQALRTAQYLARELPELRPGGHAIAGAELVNRLELLDALAEELDR